MTLTNRLSLTFLAALGLILIGFSLALYEMAATYLEQSLEDRLASTISTLMAMAEDEPGGLEWEQDERRTYPGQDPGIDQVRWVVLDESGREIDRSKNLENAVPLPLAGSRQLDRERKPWRVTARGILSNRFSANDPEHVGRHRFLTFRAGLRLDRLEAELKTLGFTLVLLSLALWGVTALLGRWICRRALAPLTKMATTARELDVAEPWRRLPSLSTGDELEALALAFNGLLDRWHEAHERQGRFAGDASHQLRTPLTALIGQADVALRREREPEEYRRSITRIRDQAERLRRIVEALLFLSRAEAESAMPSLDEFDLVGWVDEQIRRRIEDGSGDRIERSGATSPLVVRSHSSLLADVLDNLLDNARDHGGRNSVEIRIEAGQDDVRLSVLDQGPGMEQHDLSRIFEPFYRSNRARKLVPGGVGLGLSVARRISEALGGGLEVESEIGRGSRFTIRIPFRMDQSVDSPGSACLTSPSK